MLEIAAGRIESRDHEKGDSEWAIGKTIAVNGVRSRANPAAISSRRCRVCPHYSSRHLFGC
jgi:hypothetical protein